MSGAPTDNSDDLQPEGGDHAAAGVGRPSLYDLAYCDEIVTHCKDGASLTSFAASIGVCRDTITHWAKAHPEFFLAVRRAKAAACAWWETQARTITEKGGGNATLCIFGMKNMGADDWVDKQELQHGATPEMVNAIARRVIDNG
jgi:hypothetical protein